MPSLVLNENANAGYQACKFSARWWKCALLPDYSIKCEWQVPANVAILAGAGNGLGRSRPSGKVAGKALGLLRGSGSGSQKMRKPEGFRPFLVRFQMAGYIDDKKLDPS